MMMLKPRFNRIHIYLEKSGIMVSSENLTFFWEKKNFAENFAFFCIFARVKCENFKTNKCKNFCEKNAQFFVQLLQLQNLWVSREFRIVFAFIRKIHSNEEMLNFAKKVWTFERKFLQKILLAENPYLNTKHN